MKKLHIGLSFFVLIFICVVSKNIVVLINYLLALVLHEMAHLLVANSRGYSLKNFRLDLGGLSVELNEELQDKDNFIINIAGPALNILICLVCMSLYWLIPSSYKLLNTFCMSNLVLALFNLLPVYPLDGGKIFYSLIKNKKTLKKIDLIVRLTLCGLFLVMFICSFRVKVNFFFLLFSLFFLVSKTKQSPTFSIFKYKNQQVEKVVMLKVSETDNLFSLIKKIKKSHYTIFYCPTIKQKYLDEDTVIQLSTKYELITPLNKIL